MRTRRPKKPPPRSYAGQTSEQRITARREQFIDAGKELFGTVGYRKATVRGLCQAAGLTDRYFYESFETTEDLLVAVYETLTLQLRETIVRAIQDASSSAGMSRRIEIGLDAFFRQVKDPVFARIVWLEVLGVSPRVDAVYMRATAGFAEMFSMLARSVAPDIKVHNALEPVIALGAVGALSEMAKDWLLTDYARPRTQLVKAGSLILQGVARVLADINPE